MHFPSFKIYVMFVMLIFFHLKRYVWDKHPLSFKTLVKFATCNLFQLNIVRDMQSHSFKMFIMFATHIHIISHSAPRNNYYVLLIYLQ